MTRARRRHAPKIATRVIRDDELSHVERLELMAAALERRRGTILLTRVDYPVALDRYRESRIEVHGLRVDGLVVDELAGATVFERAVEALEERSVEHAHRMLPSPELEAASP